MTDELYDEAVKVGVSFYGHPLKISDEMIDPLILKAVRRINESGWVWTAESCQGHPEETHRAWAGNVRPMLRLVTMRPNVGRMFGALAFAMAAKSLDDGSPLGAAFAGDYQSFLVYPRAVAPPWFEALVYLPATYVFERNQGIAAFERFAEVVQLVAHP